MWLVCLDLPFGLRDHGDGDDHCRLHPYQLRSVVQRRLGTDFGVFADGLLRVVAWMSKKRF